MHPTLQPERRNGSPLLAPTPSHSARADAAPKAPNPNRLPGFVQSSLLTMAEGLYRGATRDQLLQLARRAVEIDRERAVGMAALLTWAAAGKSPVLPLLKDDALSWIFTATPAELQSLGQRLVELSVPGSAILVGAIADACERRTATLLR